MFLYELLCHLLFKFRVFNKFLDPPQILIGHINTLNTNEAIGYFLTKVSDIPMNM